MCKEESAPCSEHLISSYLADRSIHKHILKRLNEIGIHFNSVPDLLTGMNSHTALYLVNTVLPQITICDPAVGSGEFLAAALQTLTNIYSAIQEKEFTDAPIDVYAIKRRIITQNLYGADIKKEACEAAKLRLFHSMAASAHCAEDVEPFQNIHFHIVSGNSLIGLMQVDGIEFNKSDAGDANTIMNDILRSQFEATGIKFEQATWDSTKNKLGKPQKRPLFNSDIAAHKPLHWAYVFNDIIQKRGGFDIIITNPPWGIWKPQAKKTLSQDPAIRDAWLNYESRFPHLSNWFRSASEFKHQSAIVNGKKTGSEIYLYKLFLERSFHLLRAGGHCGMMIPSGIYTDLGSKGLRDLLFEQTQIDGLFCFDNRKAILKDVDSRFKFTVLTFQKGGETHQFPVAFMQNDVEELANFPQEESLKLDVDLIRRLSPDSHSVMEFNSELDVQIAEKILRFPLLGEHIDGTWNLKLCQEFNTTTDSHLFKTEAGLGRLPLYEGKTIHQFQTGLAPTRYWIDEAEGRKSILGRKLDEGQLLDYQSYRLGFRDVASNTNERTMIATVFPRHIFAGSTLVMAKELNDPFILLAITSLLNSFMVDFFIRKKITHHCNMFYVYQLPVPRLTQADPHFVPITHRAARLICTAPEFDDLAKIMGLQGYQDGVTDPIERTRIRAEMDGFIAHLYGLNEEELVHILETFPLVPEDMKIATLRAYWGMGKRRNNTGGN